MTDRLRLKILHGLPEADIGVGLQHQMVQPTSTRGRYWCRHAAPNGALHQHQRQDQGKKVQVVSLICLMFDLAKEGLTHFGVIHIS